MLLDVLLVAIPPCTSLCVTSGFGNLGGNTKEHFSSSKNLLNTEACYYGHLTYLKNKTHFDSSSSFLNDQVWSDGLNSLSEML